MVSVQFVQYYELILKLLAQEETDDLADLEKHYYLVTKRSC